MPLHLSFSLGSAMGMLTRIDEGFYQVSTDEGFHHKIKGNESFVPQQQSTN